MPKSHKARAPRKNTLPNPGRTALLFFLGGCCAEVYLLIVRRFYANGTMRQVVAWDGYLPILGWIGVGVLAVGAVWCAVKRRDRLQRFIAASVCGLGGYVALLSFLAVWNMSTLSAFAVVVPTVTLLGILWCLYDRECALSLTVLGLAVVGAWLCWRAAFTAYAVASRIVAVAYVLVLTALVLVIRSGKPVRIPFRKGRIHLLPSSADPLPVYGACALSALGMLVSLFGAGVANYAMWTLAVVTFGAAVYYTAKQM